MREVISLNGESPQTRAFASAMPFDRNTSTDADNVTRTVGQAGCQIANSCWEVSYTTFFTANPQIAGHSLELYQGQG